MGLRQLICVNIADGSEKSEHIRFLKNTNNKQNGDFNFMISKELFIEIIEDARKCDDYQNWLNKQLHSNGVDGYIFQPNCIDDVIKLLHCCFGKADESDIISYFIFELDYGRKWKPGMYIENDTDIDLSTPECLYNYLASKK